MPLGPPVMLSSVAEPIGRPSKCRTRPPLSDLHVMASIQPCPCASATASPTLLLLTDMPFSRVFQGYDDIPEKIADKDAKKPEDWDDEDDGEWEAPLISNPEYKGPWVQKQIANPDYKGIWEAPDIANPEFKDDPTLYAFKDLANVGFELWQVKAGSLFDNILVTDDRKYAEEFAVKTWGAMKEKEKKMFDEVKEEERKVEEVREGWRADHRRC